MSLLTVCYGPDIEALADAGGGFEALSTEALAEFMRRQWLDAATTLGFLAPLRATLDALRGARSGELSIHAAALTAFETWHNAHARALSSKLSPAARLARARVRQEVLEAHAAAYPASLWTLDAAATDLPSAACFDATGTGLSGLAFQDDAPAGFFHASRITQAGAACGWEGPVLLSLGTYPWVYGGRLFRTPPGLDWDPAGAFRPAITSMRLCASLWQPEGNLRQDARAVVFAYRYYRQATDDALRALPTYDPRRAVPGELSRRGLFLHAEQSSLELASITTARGPLVASAHNYILRRFAAFFALRRSLLLAAHRLPPDQQAAIAKNPDPCLRPYAPKGLELRP